MIAAAVVLGTLAVLLAGPVPARLTRAAWPARRPVAALVVWQAIGLGGGLSLLGAFAALAAWRSARWIGVAAFGATLLWLVAVLITSTVRVVLARRRHRYLLDLLAERERSGVTVLAHPAPAAYSVPGRRSRIVLSRGTFDLLAPDELDAVIAHERAHLRQHHDLVVQPFVAWRRSFPFLPAAADAARAVEQLVEFLADDAARSRVGNAALDGALATMADEGYDVAARRRRLYSEAAL
ncbi:MAG TPA: M56 family metallopeptidase [Jatrophihabitantaceae bacterium]